MKTLHVSGTAFMPLLAGFARGIIDSRPPNEIIRRGTPYMERWMLGRQMLVPTFVGSRTRHDEERADDLTLMQSEIANQFIHRFLRDDREDMHCHPWWNATLVLCGWYEERSPAGDAIRLPGEIVIREANERHAITRVERGTLSLFITGPKEREWGFWPEPDTFVHHREYTAWRRARGLLGESA